MIMGDKNSGKKTERRQSDPSVNPLAANTGLKTVKIQSDYFNDHKIAKPKRGRAGSFDL